MTLSTFKVFRRQNSAFGTEMKNEIWICNNFFIGFIDERVDGLLSVMIVTTDNKFVIGTYSFL